MTAEGVAQVTARSGPPERPATGVRRERRTVAVAALGMVLLVVGGVVAGALFAASGCRELRARDLGPGAAGTGGEPPTLAPAAEAGLAALAGPGASDGGRPVVRVGLGVGSRLVALEGGVAVVDGPGDTASTLTVVDDDGAVRSRTGFGRSTTVVGAAPAPYVLEVTNRATGQVDALAGLTVTLEGVGAGVCVDTAVVGTPLTFLLDAGPGVLLLLRTAEDGGDVDVELRDPVVGRRWAARLDLAAAPAGLVAARTTAMLGESLVAVGHRVTPVVVGAASPADPAAVIALAVADGSERWRLGHAALVAAGVPDGAVDVEVVAVTDAHVHVLLVPVEDPTLLRPPAHGPLGTAVERAGRRGTLLRLAAADGRVLSVTADATPDAVRVARDEGPAADRLGGLHRALGADLLDVVVTPTRTWALVAAPAGAAPGVVLVGLAP